MLSISTDNYSRIREKAKGKPDGVYGCADYRYAAKRGVVVALADKWGNVAHVVGLVIVQAGSVNRWDINKELKRVLETK